MQGAAIGAVKIDGVRHELSIVPGVTEDVTDIILNLKKILVVSHKKEPVRLMIDVTRQGEITAADIQADANIEIVNPEQVICTLDTERRFIADLEIKVG